MSVQFCLLFLASSRPTPDGAAPRNPGGQPVHRYPGTKFLQVDRLKQGDSVH